MMHQRTAVAHGMTGVAVLRLTGGYVIHVLMMFFFFKQKTAYEIKECDWSSDVCSSDLLVASRVLLASTVTSTAFNLWRKHSFVLVFCLN